MLFATKFVEQTTPSVLHKCPIYICCFLHKNNYKVFQSNIFAAFCYTWADNNIFRIFASLQLLILVRNCELVAWCLLYRCSLKKAWNMIIQLLEYAIPLLILLCHQKSETSDWLQDLMVSTVQTIIYVGHTGWAHRRVLKNEVKRLEGPPARCRGLQTFNTWYLSFLVLQHYIKAWKWYAKKWHFGGCFHHLGWSWWSSLMGWKPFIGWWGHQNFLSPSRWLGMHLEWCPET